MYYLVPMIGMGTAEELEENAAIPVDIDPEEFLPEEEEREDVLPVEDNDIVREEVTSNRWMLPVSLAIQVFSIVPGVAGGLAGFVLASKLANAKSVKASEVLLAAGTVALITFMSVFLVRTIDEFE